MNQLLFKIIDCLFKLMWLFDKRTKRESYVLFQSKKIPSMPHRCVLLFYVNPLVPMNEVAQNTNIHCIHIYVKIYEWKQTWKLFFNSLRIDSHNFQTCQYSELYILKNNIKLPEIWISYIQMMWEKRKIFFIHRWVHFSGRVPKCVAINSGNGLFWEDR